MDFVDSVGTRYQLAEVAEAPAPAKKAPVWPWVVGGLAVAGGLVWMASANSRSPNPIDPETEALIAEARNPETPMARLWASFNYSSEVRHALLDNPNLCPVGRDGQLDALLFTWMAHDYPDEVSRHPAFVLHALIEPTHEMIRVIQEVASKTSDIGLIEHFFSSQWSSSVDVRVAVAKNPHTPESILQILASEVTERERSVREAVTENPRVPENLLRSMIKEKNESSWPVRHRAKVAIARLFGQREHGSRGTSKACTTLEMGTCASAPRMWPEPVAHPNVDTHHRFT